MRRRYVEGLAVLLVGMLLGLALAHLMPHDWSKPSWEQRWDAAPEWIAPAPDAAPLGPGGVL